MLVNLNLGEVKTRIPTIGLTYTEVKNKNVVLHGLHVSGRSAYRTMVCYVEFLLPN
jgi:hypothetical protein